MMTNSNHTNDFLSKIDNLIQNDQLFKITLSKPRPQNKDVHNVYLKTADIKHQLQYSLTYRYKTRDEVKNYKKDEIIDVLKVLITDSFFNAVLFTEDEETSLLQNKKGSGIIFTKKTKEKIVLEASHDHKKTRYIAENASYLQMLGLAGKDGKIYDKSQDKYRQINKYIEILDHLIKDLPTSKPISIADMEVVKVI